MRQTEAQADTQAETQTETQPWLPDDFRAPMRV